MFSSDSSSSSSATATRGFPTCPGIRLSSQAGAFHLERVAGSEHLPAKLGRGAPLDALEHLPEV